MSDETAVLFVDDEPRILNGLRRMLRSMRGEWQMAFAEGGAEALDILSSGPFDVIVSDMRMPGVDGVELLGKVQAQYPHIARMALSGQASKETVLRSIGLAHQYLAKPCDAETLKATLRRACTLRSLVGKGELREVVSGMGALPSLPSLHSRLVEQVESPEASINEIAQTISQDLGMSARVLQLVSSAFFGRPSSLPSADKAAVFLGLDVVKALVQSTNAFSQFDRARLESLPVDSLWQHSTAVGRCARAIACAESAKPHIVDQAFVAGVLHDTGKVVFAAEFPHEYASILAAAPEEASGVTEVECRKLGAGHAEVGAYLMGLWGLPDPVVEAIALHHTPRKCPGAGFTVLTATHVADVLARQDAAAGEMHLAPGIDEAYLAGLGLSDRLPPWREACQQAMDREMANV